MSKRVLIVGGVASGAACAARLRRLDEHAEIVIYEGSAHVSFANCGLPYHIGGLIPQRRSLLVATPDRFDGWFRIEVCTRHRVEKIDRQSRSIQVRRLDNGTVFTDHYDVLVLTPGAVACRPRLAGVDLPGIFTLRNLEDMDRIQDWIGQRSPSEAVVIGGGYIGLEMVENLARRGIPVTLLEQLSQVMPPMDAEMVAPLHEELRRQKVELRLGNGVTAFVPNPDGRLAVTTANGERFVAGMAILAVGVRPDVELARQAGLEIGALRGIRVDSQMRTSDPAIFAAGDAVEVWDRVTGRSTLLALAGVAARQGRVVADVIAGRRSTFRGVQGTAVVGLFDLTAAMTGASEKQLRAAAIPYEKSYTHSLHHAGYYPNANMMTVKLLFEPKTGRLLGAQAVGSTGVDKRIDVVAMAMQQEGTVFDLEDAELCYAPPYGSVKDPINIAGAVAANQLRGDVDLVHWDQWQTTCGSVVPPAVVLDVRNDVERAATMVPGSIHIPLDEIRDRLAELPRDREIWIHCGIGQRSYYAVRILRQNGFRVRNLSGGMKSFQAMPVPATSLLSEDEA